MSEGRTPPKSRQYSGLPHPSTSNPNRANILKTVAVFCFAYNVLITSLVFIHMFNSIFQNHSLTTYLSYLFIFNSILCLINANLLSFIFSLLEKYKESIDRQHQNAFEALKIKNLSFQGIVESTLLGLFFTLITYPFIIFIPILFFNGYYLGFGLLLMAFFMFWASIIPEL